MISLPSLFGERSLAAKTTSALVSLVVLALLTTMHEQLTTQIIYAGYTFLAWHLLNQLMTYIGEFTVRVPYCHQCGTKLRLKSVAEKHDCINNKKKG